MGVWKGIEGILNGLMEFLTNVVGALLGLFSLVICLQVLNRFVIKIPLGWTEEVARYLFIWMVFLGSAVGVRKGLHYRILYLISFLSEKNKRVLEGFVHLAVLVFFYLVFTRAMDFLELMKTNKSPALMISMSLPYGSVVAFGLLGLIFSAENVVKFLLRGAYPERTWQPTGEVG